ncbi:MAG: SHOCT domain-containing protein, partial [Halobacteriaceae archaeon]
DGAGSESITGWDRDRRIGGAFTVITEQRVLIIANHLRGYDEHTIPYDSITAINLNSGIFSKRLTLQTRGATYHLSVTNSDDDEVQDAVEWLRERRRQGDSHDSTDDPLDRLEKLKNLYDNGAITEDEFEEKKASLLDEI